MLTDKEIEVLTLKKKGMTQNKIAKKLRISQPAVSSFYNNAMRKISDARETIKLKKKLKLGQGAIEFMIIFGTVLFFFVFFFGVINYNISEKNLDKEKTFLQSVTLNVRGEINLAAESSNGYYREFSIPESILGKDYDINVTENFVITSMGRTGFSYKSANVTGIIQKGVNNITKQGGEVFLNK